MKRVMVFIDGSNLYFDLKKYLRRHDVDFAALPLKLAGPNRELVRTYYYNCPVNRQDDEDRYRRQQRFFESLYRINDLEVCLGRLSKRPDGKYVEKGVDVKLATHMLSKAYKDHYDVAILVSADGDFADVVQAVKDAGKKVEVACPTRPYHLAQVADRYIALDHVFMADCWLSRGERIRGLASPTPWS